MLRCSQNSVATHLQVLRKPQDLARNNAMGIFRSYGKIIAWYRSQLVM
jgi:hypothetical protein